MPEEHLFQDGTLSFLQNALERIDDGLHPVGQQRSDLENRKLVRKTYTLPQNSTLMGGVRPWRSRAPAA